MKGLLTRWVVVLIFLLPAGLLRAFDELPVGARPTGLGEAFTALADDAHAVYYNPAGLAGLSRPEVTAYYARSYPNLSDQTETGQTFVGAAAPFSSGGRWGGLGVSFHEFKVDRLFKEQTVGLSYGKSFFSDRLSVGTNLKQLTRQFGETVDTRDAFIGNPGNRTGAEDPVFQNGHSKTAPALDLGARYILTKNLRLGLGWANVNRPNLGLTETDRVPWVTRGGVAYVKSYGAISAELSHRTFLSRPPDTRLHLGGERRWGFRRYGILALRGGTRLGNRHFREASVGAGYEINGFILDYVFVLPLGAAEGTGNMSQLSLSLKFGRGVSDQDLEDDLQRERFAAARALAALAAAESEAAFIKNERNKTLNEYATELERLRAQLEEARRVEGGETVVVPSRRLTPAQRERQARQRARKEFAAAYDASLRAYATRVSRGVDLTERAGFLKAVLEKYENKGIDVSAARQELDRVNVELVQISADYRITLDFYKKTVARGADRAERLSLLERMVKKYQRSGIDLSEVREEMVRLKNSTGPSQP